MLQRQQASAVVAARSRIVEGAVGMVQMALGKLAEEGIVELDEERKAAMSPTSWSYFVATGARSRSSTPGRCTTRTVPDASAPERKSILLRLDPAVHDALARWRQTSYEAQNAQIEFLLRRALGDAAAAGRPALCPRAAGRKNNPARS